MLILSSSKCSRLVDKIRIRNKMNLSREIEQIIKKYERKGCQDHGCTNRKVSVGTNAGCRCAQNAASDIVIFLATNKQFCYGEIDYCESMLKGQVKL
jgi:hypothetical protein